MLTPEQLANCADDIVELYAKLDEEIIRDVVRRFCQTGIITETGKLQLNALQNVGMLHSDIMRSFSEYSGISQEMTRKLFEQAAVTSLEYDMAIYLENGLEPVPLHMSPAAMQVLEAGYIKTEGNLQNLTKTTAVTTQTNFISACTLAEMKVESGAFSYNQAILDAIKLLAVEGSSVSYPSGHTDKLDVAVRRNVMTGLGQTTGQICLGYAQELGCDLMEITAHSGARPSHAAWQGQIVSLSGKKGYLTLTDIGYGTGEGFKGWNCRHDWYPYFEGSTRMYSDEDLEALNAKDVEYPDGSMHTQYEAEQRQRAYERKIRQYKRELAADDEAIKTLKDEVAIKTAKDDFDKVSFKLKSVEAELQAFCKKTDLLPANARTQVYGFGRSTAQKAVYSNKNSIKIANENFQYMQYLNDLKKNKTDLKEKQLALLQAVPNRSDVAMIKKKDLKITDLAALTAYTGDEFAYFTKGKKIILVHGTPSKWSITGDYYDKIIKEKWEWTAHSHPTTGTKIIPSKEDKDTLKLFTWQKESSIINLEGRVSTFTCDEQEWFNMVLGVI